MTSWFLTAAALSSTLSVTDRAGELFEEDFVLAESWADISTDSSRSPWHMEPRSADEELIYSALVLGLRDYLHKCGFKAAVLGLSGGIDSAVTACLAVAALGKENVRGISLPSQFSSQHSLDDARVLAERLGIHYDVIPIQPAFDVVKRP